MVFKKANSLGLGKYIREHTAWHPFLRETFQNCIEQEHTQTIYVENNRQP